MCCVVAGWDRVQTIDSLLLKGGFKGAITADVRRAVQLTRYQSQKLSISHADYVKSKNGYATNGYATNGYANGGTANGGFAGDSAGHHLHNGHSSSYGSGHS